MIYEKAGVCGIVVDNARVFHISVDRLILRSLDRVLHTFLPEPYGVKMWFLWKKRWKTQAEISL